MNILSPLFGSELRVRMLRLFLLNQDSSFDVDYIQGKTNEKISSIEKELALFKKIGFVRQGKASKIVTIKKGKKTVEKKKKVSVFSLDSRFKYKTTLADFLLKTHSLENKTVVKKLEKAGKIKAVVISGIFTGNTDSRFDLFVVGDGVKPSTMDRIIKSIELDMGKDLRYAVLSVADFAYRKSMNDKLIRDIIDYPHTILLDKVGIL